MRQSDPKPREISIRQDGVDEVPVRRIKDRNITRQSRFAFVNPQLSKQSMHKLFLNLFAIILVSVSAVAAEGDSSPLPVAQGAIPSAYVWLSGGSVAIGIGYTWGHGTLYYSKDQKEYKFKLSGVSVADVGGAGITAEGEVYNLTAPADLSGNYTAVSAGVTIIEGGSVAYLKNDKGVVIKLHSQTGGLRFNLSATGMHITVRQS